jgi:WXXGXW repeat (2 copies)
MKRTLALAALILAGAAAAPLPSLAASNVSLYIGSAPPAPVYERVPPPRRGYVWAPGYWNWSGHRHVWVPGYWVVERPGYVYNPPVWYQGGGGWYMQPARWAPYGGYERGYRDRNHDGIPDRYEHGRVVPNRYDRDGDGVPNRYDRQPDNPWRH